MPPYFLDHIVVAVRDLARAVEDWRALGLDATDGGSHPKRGTRNALVRFPDRSFLELIAVEDRALVRESAPALLAMLELHPDGPVSWALRTDDVAAARRDLASKGFRVGPLLLGEGRRDSGKVARWRTFSIEDPAFAFVLEYEGQPTADPSTRGLPIAGIAAAIIQAVSAPALAERLARAFGDAGGNAAGETAGEAGADGRVRFASGEAVVVEEPREHPGVVGAELLVADATAAAAYLRERNVAARDGWASDARLHGLRLRLVFE